MLVLHNMINAKLGGFIAAIAVVVTSICSAHAERVAFVSKGAFIIPVVENEELEDHITRTRISYLPVGTVIWLKEDKNDSCREIRERDSKNLRRIAKKRYCSITHSELGVTGMIRVDRFVELKSTNEKIVIATDTVGEIQIYNKKDKVSGSFSHSSGVYAKIVSELKDNRLPVIQTHDARQGEQKGYLKLSDLCKPECSSSDDGELTYRAKIIYIEGAGIYNVYPDDFTEKHAIKKVSRISVETQANAKPEFYKLWRKAQDKLIEEIGDGRDGVIDPFCNFKISFIAEILPGFFGLRAGAKVEHIISDSNHTVELNSLVIRIHNGKNKHNDQIVSSAKTYSCTLIPVRKKGELVQFYAIRKPAQSSDNHDYMYSVQEPMKINTGPVYANHFRKQRNAIVHSTFGNMLRDQKVDVMTQYILDQISDYRPFS